jgi:hypothetical protein
MIVHPALVQLLKPRESSKSSSSKPRLWASEVGGCLRKAMLRIKGFKPTLEFPLKSLEAMHNGVILENDTLAALKAAYGADVTGQVWLGNDMWSCYADFVMFHQQPHAAIIEHKATGDKWWNFNNELPKESHVVQLSLYKYLYKSMFNIDPQVLLYYRSWGHYAELEVQPREDHVEIAGIMDDADFYKRIAIDVDGLRLAAEAAFLAGEIPPAFPRPLDGACTFQHAPSCPMYGHCWSQEVVK